MGKSRGLLDRLEANPWELQRRTIWNHALWLERFQWRELDRIVLVQRFEHGSLNRERLCAGHKYIPRFLMRLVGERSI